MSKSLNLPYSEVTERHSLEGIIFLVWILKRTTPFSIFTQVTITPIENTDTQFRCNSFNPSSSEVTGGHIFFVLNLKVNNFIFLFTQVAVTPLENTEFRCNSLIPPSSEVTGRHSLEGIMLWFECNTEQLHFFLHSSWCYTSWEHWIQVQQPQSSLQWGHWRAAYFGGNVIMNKSIHFFLDNSSHCHTIWKHWYQVQQPQSSLQWPHWRDNGCVGG